jgi:hypothetical protein
MTLKMIGVVMIGGMGLVTPVSSAREPDAVDTTGRRGETVTTPAPSTPQRSTIVPERLNPGNLQQRRLPPADRRRLYERVEEDVDRGSGRIEDRQTHDLRRLNDARDERLGRVPPQRESDRLREEEDRQRRIDARYDRAGAAAREANAPSQRQGREGETIVTPLIDPPTSVLARQVAEDERRLTESRVRYQADLHAAEVARDEAAQSGGTREARAQADRRFIDRRSELTRQYQETRRKILGRE